MLPNYQICGKPYVNELRRPPGRLGPTELHAMCDHVHGQIHRGHLQNQCFPAAGPLPPPLSVGHQAQ